MRRRPLYRYVWCGLLATSLVAFLASVRMADALAPTCGGQVATIVGTAGDDVLVGTPGRDVIVGLGGNDTIRGLAGADRICGGEGRDRILGGKGADVLFGEGGGDKLFGDVGNDRLNGGAGNDLLVGGRGDDVLDGNRGRRDRLRGRLGIDLCRDNHAQTRTAECEGPGNAPDLGPNHFRLGSEDGTVALEGFVHGVLPVPGRDSSFARSQCMLLLLDVTVVDLQGDITTPPRAYPPLEFLEVTSANGVSSQFSEGCAAHDARPVGWWADERAMVGVTSHLSYSLVLSNEDELVDVRLKSGPDAHIVFDVPVLTSVPSVDDSPIPSELPPLLDAGTPTTQTRSDGLLTSTVQLTQLGQIGTAAHIFDSRDGQCVAIVGTVDHEVQPGLFDAERPYAPRLGVLIDGIEYTSNWPCIRPLGIPFWTLSRVVDWPQSFEFADLVFLPHRTVDDIDAIVVIQPGNEAALYDASTLAPLEPE